MKYIAILVILAASAAGEEGGLDDPAVAPASTFTGTDSDKIEALRKKNVCNGELFWILGHQSSMSNFAPMAPGESFPKDLCPGVTSTCCTPEVLEDLEKRTKMREENFKRSRRILIAGGDIFRGLFSGDRGSIFDRAIKEVSESSTSCIQSRKIIEKFPEDIKEIKENIGSMIKMALEFLTRVEKTIQQFACMICDAPATQEALDGIPYFSDSTFNLDHPSLVTIFDNAKDACKFKLFAARVLRVGIVMSCLRPIFPTDQEARLIASEIVIRNEKNLEALEALNYHDESVLAADQTHHNFMSEKEEVLRAPHLRRAILAFSFFISVVGRRFGFDNEIIDYMDSSKQLTYKMKFNRATQTARQKLYSYSFRYQKNGRSLEKASTELSVDSGTGLARLWSGLCLLLATLLFDYKI